MSRKTVVLLLLAMLALLLAAPSFAEDKTFVYPTPGLNFHGASKPFIDQSGKKCAECHYSGYYPGGDFYPAEASYKMWALWAFFACAGFIFLTGVLTQVSIWLRGRHRSLQQKPNLAAMAKSLWYDILWEKKIYQQSRLRWFVFFFVSIGFLSLLATALVTYLTRLWIPIEFFISGPGALALDFLADFFGLMILLGVAVAAWRRYKLKPKDLNTTLEDGGILLLLFLIVISGFIDEALRLAVFPLSGKLAFSFIGFLFSLPLRYLAEPVNLAIHYYFWMLHALLALVFIAWIPFTKIMHFLACPFTILTTVSEESVYSERNRYRQPEAAAGKE